MLRQDPKTESLPSLIGAVKSLMKRALWPHISPFGVTPQQLKILLILRERGELSFHELAESVWADDPTISRMVRSLIARRFVVRTADPQHGRRVRLALTPQGRRLALRLRGVTERLLARIEEGLSPAERAALCRSLRTIIQNVQTLGGSPPAKERRGPGARAAATRPRPRARRGQSQEGTA